MRVEVKTTKGYLVFEDRDPELAVYFIEGDNPALTTDKSNLTPLGGVDRKDIRRLGKSV